MMLETNNFVGFLFRASQVGSLAINTIVLIVSQHKVMIDFHILESFCRVTYSSMFPFHMYSLTHTHFFITCTAVPPDKNWELLLLTYFYPWV